MTKKIERALISVSDKTGLIDLVTFLAAQGITILSTGGTAKAIREAGIAVTDVSDYTGFPEMLDGRVKTLHPKIHGGLLGIPDNPEHKKAMDAHHIPPIGLVVVNLYPFEATVQRGADFHECVENIDIGGPSMVRSAAKNHAFTTVITDVTDYSLLREELTAHNGNTSSDFRTRMAAKAFSRTAAYDAAISSWFSNVVGDTFPPVLTLSGQLKQHLRYGENPHQKAAFYTFPGSTGIAGATQLQGKELSYNNINDADAALQLVSEFQEPAAVIIKHANPCGVALGKNIIAAFEQALASDPVSAFGGIVAVNREITPPLAEQLGSMFLEAIIAPAVSREASEILARKKNVRILVLKAHKDYGHMKMVKSVIGGFLIQDFDNATIESDHLKTVTKNFPSEAQLKDLLFAFTVCKHVRSNAIVLAKNRATIGIGAGQMSRVDSSRIAAIKAADSKEHPQRAKGSVLASDAFFPFADGVIQAAEAGIAAIIQPGGSIRDQEVIEAADKYGIAMVFTDQRHFRH